jgi:threonylcarbamoyladenosine tRNA methylthiotransferase MtaB
MDGGLGLLRKARPRGLAFPLSMRWRFLALTPLWAVSIMRLGVFLRDLKTKSYSENYGTTVALETLGCKLNQAETEALARELTEAGCRIVTPQEDADIYILNTCTVTHVADRKSRHLLRMASRRSPDAYIIALGCYADRAGTELSRIEGVDLAVRNADKVNLMQLLESSGRLKVHGVQLNSGRHNRTRSFIKAQDGCDNFCTYCIVPIVRGREKSLPPQQVINEVRQRVADGYQEIVLTGTEIGRYRYDGLDLKGLLQNLLGETDIRRLRLSSIQPQEIHPELVRLWQDPRLCRHFHVSLQSGSDTVLRRMNRRYTAPNYAGVVSFLRSEIPEVAITTDVIAGFPGETDTEFAEGFDFCRRMEFARLHIFPYSPREGTEAARMPEQIKSPLKKQRTEKMLSLAKSSLQNFHRRFIGQVREVLFEQNARGLWSGYTDTYVRVYAVSSEDLTNRLLSVKLVRLREDGMAGEF